jgi:hypothetical protein
VRWLFMPVVWVLMLLVFDASDRLALYAEDVRDLLRAALSSQHTATDGKAVSIATPVRAVPSWPPAIVGAFYVGAVAPSQHLPTGGGYDYIEPCRYDTDHRLMLGLPVDDPPYCVGATEPGESRAQRWIRTYNKAVGQCPRHAIPGGILCDPDIRRAEEAVPPALAFAEPAS